MVDRPAPLPRVLSAAAYCSLASDDEGFVEVSVAPSKLVILVVSGSKRELVFKKAYLVPGGVFKGRFDTLIPPMASDKAPGIGAR